jgi:hypothetical protein
LTSLSAAAASKNGEKNHQQDEKERRAEEALRRELSLAQRALVEAIERRLVGPEGLQATQLHLVNLFARIERFQGQIDQAFGGQAFLPNLGPTSPANIKRFNTYFEYHRKVSRLLFKAIDVWALTCSMKMDEDWVPIVLVQLAHRAALERSKAKRAS